MGLRKTQRKFGGNWLQHSIAVTLFPMAGPANQHGTPPAVSPASDHGETEQQHLGSCATSP